MQPTGKQLPSGPTTLCFYKDDFMKHDFNVESFLVECRRKVPLETLRNDLTTYQKILHSAMIELINKDYADFVNLSTNLVGLDKAINNLTAPLDQLKTEVLAVQSLLDEVATSVENKMKMHAEIREQKVCLQRLMCIIKSVEKIEKLLGMCHTDSPNAQTHTSELSGQLIERVATEFNKLQFYVNKSRGMTLVEQIKPRIANITSTLQFSLEGSFRNGLATSNTEVLRQCLRTYSTIDKMRDAEQLFRQYVVRPHMQQLITEQFINDHPSGLKGLYAAILDFIGKECKKLKDVTLSANEVVRGYDFLVYAVWPEIVNNIEGSIPMIFAPGDPVIFHGKYSVSMQFVDAFERQCMSQESVRRLRTQQTYTSFMSRWSLPVYFQIRFQEIAGAFESSLMTAVNTAEEGSEFHLHCTHVLWSCLHRCWHDDVYLSPLCHRFWKLSLQLVARFTTFLNQVTDTELSTKPVGVADEAEVGRPDSLSDSSSTEQTMPPFTITQLVRLFADAHSLANKMPSLYTDVIESQMGQLGIQNNTIFLESIDECQTSIQAPLPKISKWVTDEITTPCSAMQKMVNDIPRLYRRTNREMPTKCSSYVTGMLKPLEQFVQDHGSIVQADHMIEWITHILHTLTQQYLSITSDVLTSVRKMEESLKRLKKTKTSAQPAGSSDDDKIRLQFQLDVNMFGEQISAMGVETDSIKPYVSLRELVQNAIKST